MKSCDECNRQIAIQPKKDDRRYVAPGFERLSPAAARGMLLLDCDTGDPEVRLMLDFVNQLQGEKRS